MNNKIEPHFFMNTYSLSPIEDYNTERLFDELHESQNQEIHREFHELYFEIKNISNGQIIYQ